MIHCAIYPRKSKASDNSDSMELQVESCKQYLDGKYGAGNYTATVYGNDYGITGHSIKKRLDFQRMMSDVKNKNIQIVVILRYDRIARNMRDFCNIYHEIEKAGCVLVSVSQQIDTSTPYGKNFMYQMASMAELEWALTSERYKDMHRYKIAHGMAYTGKLPHFGFKIVDKHIVHDREEETRAIFEHLRINKSKQETVRFVRLNYEKSFSRRMLEAMVNSDLYLGRVRNNLNYCEPYFTEDYMNEIRSINCIKATPTGNIYLFTGLLKCPICGRRLSANPSNKNGKLYTYYRCPNSIAQKHKHYSISQEYLENAIVCDLKAYLDIYSAKISNLSRKGKQWQEKQIKGIEDAMKRIDHLYEMGRLTIEEYDIKIISLQEQLKSIQPKTEKKIVAKDILIDNWQEIYLNLTEKNKRIFIQNIIEQIVIDSEKNITNIIFK